jgi:hypothetical protein
VTTNRETEGDDGSLAMGQRSRWRRLSREGGYTNQQMFARLETNEPSKNLYDFFYKIVCTTFVFLECIHITFVHYIL